MREDYQEQPNRGRPVQYPSEADMIREQLEHDLNESEAARTGGNDPEAPVDTSLHSKPEPLHASIGDAIDPKTLGVLARFRKPIERPKAVEPEPNSIPDISETRPSQGPIEQQSKFDATELEALKAGDAVVGANGGRVFIAERREEHGKILFDVFFRGNPEMKTFTLDQLKNAGAGIQAVERRPENPVGSVNPEVASEEQIQHSKTFDRVFLEELKQTPAHKFKSKKEAEQAGPVPPVQTATSEQIESSKRFDREFLEVLKATPAERFLKRNAADAPKNEVPAQGAADAPEKIGFGRRADDAIEDDERRRHAYRTMAERDGVKSLDERNSGKKKRNQKATM